MNTVVDSDLDRCLQEAANAASASRRMQQRFPFFHAVMLDAAGARGIPAFSHNVSMQGIGLLHARPLDPGRVTVTFPKSVSRRLEFGVDIGWCTSVADEGFLSGGKFAGTGLREATSILAAVLKGEASRRLKQRHPFMRPVKITLAGDPRSTFSAFSRDISASGIGLIHRVPLSRDRLILEIPSTTGPDLTISADVRWCEPAGDGWYASGGEFVRLMLEEAAQRNL